MSIKICTCAVVKDMWGKTVHVNPSPGCQMHGKDRAKMESVNTVSAYQCAYCKEFYAEPGVCPIDCQGKKPVCNECKDTHKAPFSGNMCTSCPTPCESCRSRGPGQAGGPYCKTTPCPCTCHDTQHQYKDRAERRRQVAVRLATDTALVETVKRALSLLQIAEPKIANPAFDAVYELERRRALQPMIAKPIADESWDVRAHPTERGVFYLEGPWRTTREEVEKDRIRVLSAAEASPACNCNYARQGHQSDCPEGGLVPRPGPCPHGITGGSHCSACAARATASPQSDEACEGCRRADAQHARWLGKRPMCPDHPTHPSPDGDVYGVPRSASASPGVVRCKECKAEGASPGEVTHDRGCDPTGRWYVQVSSNASPGHTCDPDGGGIYDLRCAGCVAVRIAMVGPMLEITPRTGSAQMITEDDACDAFTDGYVVGYSDGADLNGSMREAEALAEWRAGRCAGLSDPNDDAMKAQYAEAIRTSGEASPTQTRETMAVLNGKGWVSEGKGRWHHPDFDDDATHTFQTAWEEQDNTKREPKGPTQEQRMLSIDLDENGNPKSSIPIDAHASAHLEIFYNEMLDSLDTAVVSRISPTIRKGIFIMAEKAYRMGVARDHGEHRKMKESYDKMARLVGALIGAVFDVRRAKTLEEAQTACARVLEGDELPTVEQINEQRASFAYGQLALTSGYHDASPEKLAELRALCRKAAGCKP